MNSIVCHLGAPRTSKPATLAEYGKMREKIIQQPWECVSEHEFINLVTEKGCPFYGGLMNGRDLMEIQYEKLVWRMQSLVGLDFDVCEVSGDNMTKHFQYLGLKPWLGYYTFSNNPANAGQSYRLLWRVDTDLNLTYDECATALKKMRTMTNNMSDKNAANPTRLWQGTNSGFFHYAHDGKRLNLKELAK
jgi:hypothetical protein